MGGLWTQTHLPLNHYLKYIGSNGTLIFRIIREHGRRLYTLDSTAATWSTYEGASDFRRLFLNSACIIVAECADSAPVVTKPQLHREQRDIDI